MRLQDNIGTLIWTALGKIILVLYGFVALYQIRFIPPEEFGLYALFQGVLQFIVLLGDGFALDIIIRYGANPQERLRADGYALRAVSIIYLGISLLLALISPLLSILFKEPRIADVMIWLPLSSLAALPRAFGLKILTRNIEQKKIFWVELAFILPMVLATFVLIATDLLSSFESLMVINLIGLGCSSVIALLYSRQNWHFSMSEGTIPISEYRKFTAIQGYTSAAQNSIRHLDVYIIQLFFSTTVVGIYNSAKTLYRLFEHAFVAAVGLAAPLFARLYQRGNLEELHRAVGKVVSFLLLSLLPVCVLLWSGGAEIVINTLLPEQYSRSIQYFKLLLIAVIFMPFSILLQLSMVRGALQELLLTGVGGATVAVLSLIVIGVIGAEWLIPLGQISLTATTGIIALYYTRKVIPFTFWDCFRAIKDIRAFLIKRDNKKRHS